MDRIERMGFPDTATVSTLPFSDVVSYALVQKNLIIVIVVVVVIGVGCRKHLIK